METYENEIWKTVVGYPMYEVSNLGRVRSWNANGGGAGDRTSKRRSEPKVLKHKVNGSPGRKYPAVTLYEAGKARVRHIHRLVAEAFLGPRPEGMWVCHADDDPLNNNANNLRYDTPSANARDAIRNGGIKQGQAHASAKLTDAEILIIREMKQMGGKAAAIANRFGVSESYVNTIGRGARSEGVETPWIIKDAVARGLGTKSLKKEPVITPREPRLEGPWKNPQVA